MTPATLGSVRVMLPHLPSPRDLLPPLPGPRDLLAASLGVARSGLVRPFRPDRLPQIGWALLRHGAGPGFGPLLGAALSPGRPAIVDDDGSLTFGELDARCSAVAAGLAATLSPGDTIGLLARNSAGFYETMVGAARSGLNVVYLNPGFPAGQLADTVTARSIRALVYDQEFAGKVPSGVIRIPMADHQQLSIERLAAEFPAQPGMVPLFQRTRHTMLTSGTTGRPKGVPRSGGDLGSVISLLSGLPNRTEETWLVAVPMFHAWGWLHALLSMMFRSTLVLTREFDAERVLALIERERCQVLVAVPTMLRRIMSLPPEVRRRYDTSSLRAVTVSGSALPAALAAGFTDEFGDVLYSLYGSTEAGYVAVAGPADLRAAPGTVGRPLPLVSVRVLGSGGSPVPAGARGMIWVSSRDAAGAGDGDGVSTGDLGWLDEAGRLFIAGRSDDMIISGGENIYPDEVESVLEQHPLVAEAAVTGRPDEAYGQAVVAHLVVRDETEASPAALRAWCRERLAPFQVPKQFVFHGQLPRNAAGKVLKRELDYPA